jgi:hypothetical protein
MRGGKAPKRRKHQAAGEARCKLKLINFPSPETVESKLLPLDFDTALEKDSTSSVWDVTTLFPN